MGEYSEAFVGFDTAKVKHSVAIADSGRSGEVRFLGEVSSSPATVARLIAKLAGRYQKLHICYEAGPTGYGLYRQMRELGHDCTVVAPSLIPKRPGERVKTNRRDAVTLARLLRAGELTPVWVPDATHEAVRDLEHYRAWLNRRRGFPRIGISDSRCWLGLGASIDGETLFTGPSGPGGGVGYGRPVAPQDGGVVRGEHRHRGEMVAALPGQRECGGPLDGRSPAAPAGDRARVAVGADCGETGPHPAGDHGRVGRPRDCGELRRGMGFFCQRRDHLQKKACTPASRTASTSRAGGLGGSSIRAGLTPSAWSLSTRPGPRPT